MLPIIGYALTGWDQGWTSRRRLMQGLASRGWPAVYSSGALSVWERMESRWRQAPLLGRVEEVDRMLIDRPGKLLLRWPRHPAWDRFVLSRHSRRLRASLRADHERPVIAILFDPVFWPYVAALRPRFVVYFVYDGYSLTPGWTERLADCERALVERADLIAGSSRQMLDLLPGDGPARARELCHGVDYEAFRDAAHADPPDDLAAIPRPRIGYTGRINQKLDIELVEWLARSEPSRHWVFVGPTSEGGMPPAFVEVWQRCLALPNVHHLGGKPHTSVPRYMRHMDVNIMCYRTEGGWWSVGYPLKMPEYLAVGRPVVSADLGTVRPFEAVVDIARSREQWAAAIDRALNAGGVGHEEERYAVARANSWDSRVDQLEQWLRDMIAG